MFPFIPVIFAVRALSGKKGAGGGGRGGLLIFLAGSFLFSISIGLTGTGHPVVGIALGVTSAVVMFPWFLTRRLLVPLGMHRAAFHLTRAATLKFYGQRLGGSAFAAAWALSRRSEVRPADVEWVARKIDRPAAKEHYRGAWLAALGLLQALRGERDQARATLLAVCGMSRVTTRPHVFSVAFEWCSAEAADRGAWEEVLGLGQARRISAHPLPGSILGGNAWLPFSRTSLLMRTLAKRAIGQRKPGGFWVWLAWALAPRRRHTWSLCRGVLARSSTPRGLAPSAVPAEAPTLAETLGASCGWLRNGAQVSPEMETALEGWSALLDSPAMLEQLTRRARELGAANPAQARARLRSAVEVELRDLRPADVISSVLAVNPLVQGALRQRDAALADELDLMVSRARDFLVDESKFTALEAYQAYLGIRRVHEQLARSGGHGTRRTAFASDWSALNSIATRLFNILHEQPLANEVFRWLLVEADAVGDVSARELLVKNVACGDGGAKP